MDPRSLIFGVFSRHDVLPAVADATWQAFRISLLGTQLDERLQRLRRYVDGELPSTSSRRDREIQVTNYVYALKRGGMIKDPT